MAENYRYLNLRDLPVIVPGKEGGMITFAHGQGSSDPWFSRFVGRGGLSKVPVGADPDRLSQPRTARPPQPRMARPPTPVEQPQEMLDIVEPPEEESTPNWSRRAGIYACRVCRGLFRTGSVVVMQRHLSEYHKIDLSAPPPEPAPAPAPAPTPEKVEPEPATVDEAGDTAAEAASTGKAVFICPTCGRQYKTEDGLKKHAAKAHSSG